MGALFVKLVLSGVFRLFVVNVDLSHVQLIEHLLRPVVVIAMRVCSVLGVLGVPLAFLVVIVLIVLLLVIRHHFLWLLQVLVGSDAFVEVQVVEV